MVSETEKSAIFSFLVNKDFSCLETLACLMMYILSLPYLPTSHGFPVFLCLSSESSIVLGSIGGVTCSYVHRYNKELCCCCWLLTLGLCNKTTLHLPCSFTPWNLQVQALVWLRPNFLLFKYEVNVNCIIQCTADLTENTEVQMVSKLSCESQGIFEVLASWKHDAWPNGNT